MEAFIKDHFKTFRPTGFGNEYKGPHTNRKLSPGSWVEFSGVEVAKAFLSNVSLSSTELNVGSKKLMIKPARTELQRKRNYAMRKAEELIKASTHTGGKEVKIEWKVDGSRERLVTVNGTAAFKQEENDVKGVFLQPFADLVIP